MPFDNFFSSESKSWSKAWREKKKQSALHKYGWSDGGQFVRGEPQPRKSKPEPSKEVVEGV